VIRLILRLILKAIPLVIIVLLGWWIINKLTFRPPEAAETVSAQPGVLDAIKHTNKQIFVEYYITKDIDYSETPDNWTKIFGLKQQYVVLLKGRVPAGLDVSKVTDDDIWVSADASEVQLTLPPPEVFEDEVSLDLKNSRILIQKDTCPNLLCSDDDATMLLTKVLPEGKSLIIADAREGGILFQAARDGQLYYENLLRSLGFDTVHVIVTGYTD